MKKLVAILVVTACMVVLSGGLVNAEEYRLGPGDVLAISVWGYAELSTSAYLAGTNGLPNGMPNGLVISPDGKFSFPLIGEITADGLTTTQLTGIMTKALKEYIVDPRVSVNVVKLRTTRVYVLGEVPRPGMYELEKQHNLLDAIGIAGGYTPNAAKKSVFLIRNGKNTEPQKLNLLKLLKEGDMSQNVLLGDGDLVFLTSNGKVDFVRDILPYITGAYYVTRFDNK